jgi:AAA+ ATPase superfamily predicted ATPase
MVGRKLELAKLQEITESEEAEFVVVFGRRRVGKTYLIREFFQNNFTFYHTGMANENLDTQLKAFNSSLNNYSSIRYPQAKTWFDAFEQLINLLLNSRKRGKKVIFIDEMPWLDTKRSGFVSALEYFWNSFASARKDIILITCGSATSWITNKILKNHGGLHNRITQQIYLQPFTLSECEEFFKSKKIEMSQYEIAENYMIFGGIPYYLNFFKKNLSMNQNVDNLLFSKQSPLYNEFDNLYASLFKNHEFYVKIVEALSTKIKGLTREELLETTKIGNGGNFTKILNDLEMCGFIRKYRSFEKKERNALYQLCDFYTFFYFNFLKNNLFDNEHFWQYFIESGQHHAWAGYAFEQVCLSHIKQIKKALGISGVLTKSASWRSLDRENPTQIDLLIARNDNVINLCEIKYSKDEFIIDKDYDKILRNKRSAFKNETKTHKAVHLTMITTYGVKRNMYSGNIQSQVTLKELFDEK